MIAGAGAGRTSARRIARAAPEDVEAINAAAGGERDATFPRTIRKSFKAINSTTQETTLVRIPWGPRISVAFDPRGAFGIPGGTLFVYAMAESTTFLIGTLTLTVRPTFILAECGCDGYVVTALLGSPVPAGQTQVESYVCAMTYAGTV